MYLRRHRRTVADTTCEYWTLVESRRTASGPRQRTVATLGKLPGLDEQVHAGWDSLEDLLGVSREKINDDRLYRGLDALREHKEKLTQHLLKRCESWFGVGFEFLICDVTSTFFEGQVAGNPQAARGYSRDNRPDCKQVCIGLAVSPEGLPLAYEVFAGNRADVTTVEDIVRVMEEKYGQAKRIWVLDRGMVSEENLEFLRQHHAQYIVGTPKAQLRRFEAALLENQDWKQVRPGVEVKLPPHPDGQGREQFVLCRSQARREKEKAMPARQEERLWQKLLEIHQSLQKKPTPADQIERRVGKWPGRHPAADKLFEVAAQLNPQKQACALNVAGLVDRSQWARQAHGAYLLRTNCAEQDPAKIWEWYLQLQQAEAAFRCAKSDLSLRPIFHHKAERVEAHILVCFLSLALWRALEQWMKGKGLGTCARQLVAELATIKSLDVVLPVKAGENASELRLRTVARPERLVAELMRRLGLHLPEQSRTVQNAVENVVRKTGV